MKIGIITHPLYTNYGGILQAYALQTVLERMGHEVCEVEIKRKKQRIPAWKFPISITKRLIFKYLFGKGNHKIFLERYENKVWPLISSNTRNFVDKYMHQKLVSSFLEVKDKFDAFIVGSDQVWRYKYYPWFGNDIANVFLGFVPAQTKKIAYAASFGTDEWEYPDNEAKRCQEFVRKFDAISVREMSGIKLCKEHLYVEASCVLDPTLLLTKDDYLSLIKQSQLEKSKGNLFCYVLDSDMSKTNIIKNVANEKQLIPFFVNAKVSDVYALLEERIQPPVEEWLRGFYDSEFVITDSFHACVFSILFHKQFVVIGNEERGLTRFKSLLSTFGLESRLIDSSDKVNGLDVINYDKVDEKLNELRAYSYSFLNNALKV